VVFKSSCGLPTMRCELTCSGLAWYPVYGLGVWMLWKGTLCMDRECGWFGKVPGVRFGSWTIPDVWIGNVDVLERYLVYEMRLWMVWKGAQSTIWLMIVSIIESRV
jgi:hypothetical protein